MKNQFFYLVVWIIISVFSFKSISAQSVSIWDGTSEIWTQGNGTEDNPYLIQNAQQLAYIAEMVNGGVTHYENTYFKLTTNVQIDSTTAWEPIGLNGTYYFSGNFNGDNHFVTLFLHTSSLHYVGLFGYIKNAKIENLGIGGELVAISNLTNNLSFLYCYCGSVVGYAKQSSTIISNCYSTADLTVSNSINSTSTSINSYSVSSYLGGIAGYANDGITITNCYNSGTISASSIKTGVYSCRTYTYSGGITGSAVNTAITNCHNTGMVSAYATASTTNNYSPESSSCAGGITGYYSSSSSSSITECYNFGDVISSSSSRKIKSWAGGIVGDLIYNSSLGYYGSKINKCFNTGNVTATAICAYSNSTSESYAGGVVGYASNYHGQYANISLSIENCYNTGTVTVPSSSSSYIAGGVIGYVLKGAGSQSSAKIKNCYNVGTLIGATKGGVRGASNGSSITNCYYLNICGGTESGGTSKTEAQMKSSSFPVILNTDSVVFVKDITPNINQGYPVFGSVRTLSASNIGNTIATLNGNYQMLYDVDEHGFEYKKTSESDYTTVVTTGYSPVSKPITGLQGGTQYTYRFFVQKDGVYYRGEDKTFNTIQCTLSAQITASSNTLCEGDSVTLTVTATSSNPSTYSYTWSTNSHSNSISVADGANYTVTVTDSYGCSATQSKQMTIYPAAVASITGSTIICNNGSTTLTANGGQYYSWNTGSAQRIITVSQPGTYIATVQTVYGCTASDTVEVTAFANPVISGNLTFCNGDYTTLTASGGDTYLWSNGATTPSINVNTSGTYSVTASTSNGCSGNAAVSVMQNPIPDVQISGNTVICSGVGTTLTATSNASYAWSTGESGQSITAYNPGSYSVTVTNTNGCSNYATVNVTTMEPVSISGNTHICSGQSTTLSVNGTGSYAWSNGASTSFVTVTNPGTYTVTVSLPNGCSSSASAEVTAASLPTPSISGNTTVCQGQTTILTANGGTSYEWSNGSTTSSINVSQSGVYTVTATNAEGCTASTNITITVNPLPSVNITGNSSFCQGDNTTLTATGASTYAWSNSQSGNAITVNNAGTYTVTGTDANGCTNTATKTVSINPTYNISLTHSICQGDSYNFHGQNLTTAGTYTHTLQTVNGCDSVLTLTLTVKALPTPSITGNTSVCEGQSTTLTASGGVSYAWSNGSTMTSVTVSQSGVYTMTATNAEGCSASANITVSVNPLPNITIGGNTTICEGSSTTLTASGADTYSWNTGDNTASVNISSFGVYTVTGTSSAGCSSTANVTVLVSQLPVITITGETDICTGETTTLSANGCTTYLWSNGTTDASITTGTPGTYQVIGYNEVGCNAMASATVNVWQPASSEFTIVTEEPCYTWNDIEYCTSGDYTQTLQTIHSCDSVVTLHLTITVGVDDYDLSKFIIVYPNPTSNVVHIKFFDQGLEFTEIHLYDAYGKLLQTIPVINEITQIDLSRYANGIYFVKAMVEGKTITVQKVMKN